MRRGSFCTMWILGLELGSVGFWGKCLYQLSCLISPEPPLTPFFEESFVGGHTEKVLVIFFCIKDWASQRVIRIRFCYCFHFANEETKSLDQIM